MYVEKPSTHCSYITYTLYTLQPNRRAQTSFYLVAIAQRPSTTPSAFRNPLLPGSRSSLKRSSIQIWNRADSQIFFPTMTHDTRERAQEEKARSSLEESGRLCGNVLGGMFGCSLPAGHEGSHFGSAHQKRARTETERFAVPGPDVPQRATRPSYGDMDETDDGQPGGSSTVDSETNRAVRADVGAHDRIFSQGDCGDCGNCKDKPKFGGLGTRKKVGHASIPCLR